MQLGAEPSVDVTVTLSNLDTSEHSASDTSLTFTNLNWNSPQTITFTGQDDDLVDGLLSYQVTFTSTSTDGNYNALTKTLTSMS